MNSGAVILADDDDIEASCLWDHDNLRKRDYLQQNRGVSPSLPFTGVD